MSKKIGKYRLVSDLFICNGVKFEYQKGDILNNRSMKDYILFVERGYLINYLIVKGSLGPARFIYGPGDIIQTSLLVSGGRSDLTYSMLNDVILYGIRKPEFIKQTKNNSLLLSELLAISVEKSEYWSERIENLSYQYASDKLIYRILFLAERYGMFKNDKVKIIVPLTHSEIGSFINMARESVSREMKKLKDKHLIEYSNRIIVILDLKRLITSLHEDIRSDWSELVSN